MERLGRREWLALATSALGGLAWSGAARAETARRFEPKPGPWRSFELTTTIEIENPNGATRVWLPIPSLDTAYQESLDSRWSAMPRPPASSPMRTTARACCAPISTRATRNRRSCSPAGCAPAAARSTGRNPQRASEDADTLHGWTRATALMPTDGIVLATAREAVGGAKSDEDKAHRLYDWVVSHTYREPKVRGCGIGDIKTMLETANFGGKCGDINGLFVGMSRALGIPARDVYGIRVAPSAFGYRELGGNPAKLQGAQHCRAEVFLKAHGWVAMDPADVGKVMRLETPEWIRDVHDPLVAPVNQALFGGWEGNWLGFNTAHDVALPGSSGSRLGFLMYPQAENANGRYDTLDPDHFKYTITAQELLS